MLNVITVVDGQFLHKVIITANTKIYAMNALEFHKKLEKNVDISSGYKQLCRFCLEGATKKIDNKSVELFKLLTNVELVTTPEYPKSICSLCESQLQSACKFRVSLLDMEQCWTEFFHLDYLQFIKRLSRIDISEEHIYDEIFLEIEMDARDEYDFRLEKLYGEAKVTFSFCINLGIHRRSNHLIDHRFH